MKNDKAILTATKTPISSNSEEQLVDFLFLESELDADLKQIIACWPALSVELRQAILKMIR